MLKPLRALYFLNIHLFIFLEKKIQLGLHSDRIVLFGKVHTFSMVRNLMAVKRESRDQVGLVLRENQRFSSLF